MKKVKLRNQLVLVSQEEPISKERKIGSIIIPDTVNSMSKIRWGRVVETGAGTEEFPMEVKVFDRVCYLNDEGRIQIDGNILLKQEDILFVDDEE